jgi:hypothetical protein
LGQKFHAENQPRKPTFQKSFSGWNGYYWKAIIFLSRTLRVSGKINNNGYVGRDRAELENNYWKKKEAGKYTPKNRHKSALF